MDTITLTEGESRRLTPPVAAMHAGTAGYFNVFTDDPSINVAFVDGGVTVEQAGGAAHFNGAVVITHQGDRAEWRARTFGGN